MRLGKSKRKESGSWNINRCQQSDFFVTYMIRFFFFREKLRRGSYERQFYGLQV